MRLLIVEDEDGIRSALARGLARPDRPVACAATVDEARAVAGSFHPDALISDLKLPDGSGLELARELGVPFVLMSGYATLDDAVGAMRLGCVDLFTKPVALKDLRRAAERLAAREGAAPTLYDPAAGRILRATPGSLAVEALSAVTVTWHDAASARERFAVAAALAGSVTQRLVVAELMQAAPAGRLVINRQGDEWRACLHVRGGAEPRGLEADEGADPAAEVVPPANGPTAPWRADADLRQVVELGMRRALWRDQGVLVVDGAVMDGPDQPAAAQALPTDAWLWPRSLPDVEVLDLGGVPAIGTWSYRWFRSRPYQAVRGAGAELKRQLLTAGVPVLWNDPAPARDAARPLEPGVGGDERRLLLE